MNTIIRIIVEYAIGVSRFLLNGFGGTAMGVPFLVALGMLLTFAMRYGLANPSTTD